MTHTVSANVGNAQVTAVQQNPVEMSKFFIKSPSFFKGDRTVQVEKSRTLVTVRDIRIASAEQLNLPIESILALVNGEELKDNFFIPRDCNFIMLIKV